MILIRIHPFLLKTILIVSVLLLFSINANKLQLIEYWNLLLLLTRADYKDGLYSRCAETSQQEILNDFHSVGLLLPLDETSGKCY